MTLMDFFGCACLAFGPPLAMFTFTVAAEPIRIIILIASAFFWLISLLLSSVLWYAVVPLQEHLAFGLVFSVLFQEGFRYLLYWVLRKAERGLEKVTTTHVADSRHVFAYVCGLGFGFMSGAFALVNVLADAVGPENLPGGRRVNGHRGSKRRPFLSGGPQVMPPLSCLSFVPFENFDTAAESRFQDPATARSRHPDGATADPIPQEVRRKDRDSL
ncbi:gamma-secretase subunit Aph-1 isoform X2 [Monomorium pharaonis]|uniref:gamma-secretase subunit Aph-1 isoform X2 n=1 Tax=Monomorium pharaonis TaxID=307658 RepID=UPI0017475330|nr:gamma-secretase subunit Aph-1 isoform X2 [Monomorium pharaonis]